MGREREWQGGADTNGTEEGSVEENRSKDWSKMEREWGYREKGELEKKND
jgi:hypothetical protein